MSPSKPWLASVRVPMVSCLVHSWPFTLRIIQTKCSDWSKLVSENIWIFNRDLYQERATSGWECANYSTPRWARDLNGERRKWSNPLLSPINPAVTGRWCAQSHWQGRRERGGSLLFPREINAGWLQDLSLARRAGKNRALSCEPQAHKLAGMLKRFCCTVGIFVYPNNGSHCTGFETCLHYCK